MTQNPLSEVSRIPEVDAIQGGSSSGQASRIRIPPSMDVPVTDRVTRLIDTAPMRRLASISQLGLVSLVYPGATHSRLEHSLGVYANGLRVLNQCCGLHQFSKQAQEAFLVAALVHDAGHWPFCHPIEDIGPIGQTGDSVMRHEDRVERLLSESAIAECLRQDWQCHACDVMAILSPEVGRHRDVSDLASASIDFFASCLSGPIDIDKLDYLQRDSLHAGVPYGRNFDPERIVQAWQPHPELPKLALSEKGKTAAEMMVFGRYVMFSEVYWHHTVRAATAMLQRAVFVLSQSRAINLSEMAELPDGEWVDRLLSAAKQSNHATAGSLVDGLFGSTRVLLKRVAEFNVESGLEIHERLARRPYWWLAECGRPLAKRISDAIGDAVDPDLVLIDAPPVKLEVDINIDVINRQGNVLTLGDVSPVASVLANRQFDNHVKRVRVFVPSTIRSNLDQLGVADAQTMSRWLAESIDETEATIA